MNSTVTTKPSVLASDLDGTLIPLSDDKQNEADLRKIAGQLVKNQADLMFVTGRHFESVSDAIEKFNLPTPNWIICDVGTSIYHRQGDSNWNITGEYVDKLSDKLGLSSMREIRTHLENLTGIRLQEEEKQGQFKLSYYVNATQLDTCRQKISAKLSDKKILHDIIASVDPFNGDGLLDILPHGVSKAYALTWLSHNQNIPLDRIVFAGDSGNDFDALTAGFKAIVVGNADRELAASVELSHRENRWNDRLFLANQTASSGVLQGCCHFGLFGPET